MRLIDADRLLTKQMQSKYYHLPNGDVAIPIIDIKHAPTVEVPEIVRCKDCKYGSGRCQGIYIQFVTCCKTGTPHKEDWYCANGERKDDND